MGLVYEQTLNKASYLKCREEAFLENALDTVLKKQKCHL